MFLRDCGDTEIGGFGIAASADPLWIEDVRLVRQECTAVTVAFDDASVADFFDEMVDRGLKPEQFARVWLHTHPGNSPEPSRVDEETFARSFGNTDWAVMAILARGGQRFARLQFHLGPGGALALPVQVDYSCPFPAADPAAWEAEYLQCVQSVMSSHPDPHWLEPLERSGSRDESRTF
jgi:proteasome lid subunit RPN8/RPN11